MKEQIASESRSNEAQIRAFLEAAWPRSPLDEPRVRHWRAAGRTTLLVLLASSGLQYYFFNVYLTIMALPRVTLVAGLP